MAKQSIVTLTDEERANLQILTIRGTHSARQSTRADFSLQADAGLSAEAMAQAAHVGHGDAGPDL